jgi:hypothetical protein
MKGKHESEKTNNRFGIGRTERGMSLLDKKEGSSVLLFPSVLGIDN